MLRSVLRTAMILTVAIGSAASPALAQSQDNGSTDSWSSWTGLYAGASVGGALLGSSDDNGIAGLTSKADHDSWGGIGGVHLGYNFFTRSFLLGIEGDVSLMRGKTSAKTSPDIYGFPGSLVNSTESDWSASLRVRAGLPMGVFLPYVTAGVTIADIEIRNSYTAFPGFTQSKSETATGFTIGGGLEMLITRNISLRAEYLHTEFEKVSNTGLTDPGGAVLTYDRTSKPTTDIIRAGVSFRF
jgi:outer membrane immunogenic protein